MMKEATVEQLSLRLDSMLGKMTMHQPSRQSLEASEYDQAVINTSTRYTTSLLYKTGNSSSTQRHSASIVLVKGVHLASRAEPSKHRFVTVRWQTTTCTGHIGKCSGMRRRVFDVGEANEGIQDDVVSFFVVSMLRRRWHVKDAVHKCPSRLRQGTLGRRLVVVSARGGCHELGCLVGDEGERRGASRGRRRGSERRSKRKHEPDELHR